MQFSYENSLRGETWQLKVSACNCSYLLILFYQIFSIC